MKKLLFSSLCLLLLGLSGMGLSAEKIYLDAGESKAGFSIIKFKIGAPVEGEFEELYGEALYDADKKTISSIQGIIFAPSIDTDNEKRDHHLRTEDFFNVSETPLITFKAQGPFQLNKSFTLKGNLSIRGKTKPVELAMKTLKSTDKEVVIEGEGKINRLDYGVSWNRTLEKSDWKKVLGILGKTVLDETVTLKLKFAGKVP